MKEVKLAFRSLAEGLRIFAKSLEVLAEQVNAMGGTAKPSSSDKPVKPAAAKKSPKSSPKKAVAKKASKASSKKAAPKKAPAKAKTPAKAKKPAKGKKSVKAKKPAASGATSVENVYNIIARSKKGVSSAQISAKTGYDAKKVANVVYKLKNRNQIEAIKKGIYVKK